MGGSGDQRSWTDDDLRDAIRSERSWRGVARVLGLRSTSTNPIKQHAARLSLDTSHFTGQRSWSDLQLKEAVTRATSWSDVLRILDLQDSNDARPRVKAHVVRLGLDIAHLEPDRSSPGQSCSLDSARADLSMLRRAAPSIATAWFTMRCFPVAIPAEPEAYDLLVTTDQGIQRVQVKSTTSRARDGKWIVRIGRRPYVMDKSAGKIPYDPDLLDYFFIVSGDGGIYLFPSRVLAGQVAVYPDSYPDHKVGALASLLG